MKTLIDFIEQYRPGFSDEVVPADEEDVHFLERLAGPLPGAYRRFLDTMGASLGGLELGQASLGIAGNIATYRHMPWLRRERYLCVAGDEGLAAWDYFLDRARPHGSDDCMLVRMPLDEHFPVGANHPRFAGLEEFLFFQAFKELRLPLFRHTVDLAPPKEQQLGIACRPEAVQALAQATGFRRIPPALRCALYERGDAGLLVYQHPIEPTFCVRLGAEDFDELERLATIFERQAGVVRDRSAFIMSA